MGGFSFRKRRARRLKLIIRERKIKAQGGAARICQNRDLWDFQDSAGSSLVGRRSFVFGLAGFQVIAKSAVRASKIL